MEIDLAGVTVTVACPGKSCTDGEIIGPSGDRFATCATCEGDGVVTVEVLSGTIEVDIQPDHSWRD